MLCMLMHAAMMGSHQAPQPAPPQMPEPQRQISALELLKIRYVKGEITRAQFEEMRQVLAEATKEG